MGVSILVKDCLEISAPESVKAIVCRHFGSIDELQFEEFEPAPLAASEVRVRVHACGSNFADLLPVRGQYQERPELTFCPGGEIAGTVVAIGCVQDRKAVGKVVVTSNR